MTGLLIPCRADTGLRTVQIRGTQGQLASSPSHHPIFNYYFIYLLYVHASIKNGYGNMKENVVVGVEGYSRSNGNPG